MLIHENIGNAKVILNDTKEKQNMQITNSHNIT